MRKTPRRAGTASAPAQTSCGVRQRMKWSWKAVLLGLGGATFVLAPGGCDTPPTRSVQIGTIDHDLARGSTGPEVAALNDQLKTYGYFPNEELQGQYPAWRPIVPTAPSDWTVFDANVEQAVSAYQKNMGLQPTGVFDAATRAEMAASRCGVPDGIAALDPSDKWSSASGGQNQVITATFWQLNTSTVPSNLTVSNVLSDIASTESAWAAYSRFNFTQGTGSGTYISIGFGPITPLTKVGVTQVIGSITYVTLNSLVQWSDIGTPDASHYDVQSTLLHELGHALGLFHSSFTDAVMYPNAAKGVIKTAFSMDDIEGIAALNSAFKAFAPPPTGSTVFRAAYNDHVFGPSVWALSGATGGGYQIWEKNGSQAWVQHPGGAIRIAADPANHGNQPWVVNDQGQVFRWNGSIQNWDNVNACATDIGVGTDDSVWVIGCDSAPGGFHIYKFTGSSVPCSQNCWTQADDGALQISVGPKAPDDGTNVPWVINNSGQVRRRQSSDPTSPGWDVLPALPNSQTPFAIAAIAGTAYVFPATSPSTMYTYNWQPFVDIGDPTQDPPAENQWFPFTSTSVHWTSIAPSSVGPLAVFSNNSMLSFY